MVAQFAQRASTLRGNGCAMSTYLDDEDEDAFVEETPASNTLSGVHSDTILSVAVSPQLVATGGRDKRVAVWTALSQPPVMCMLQPGIVYGVAISADEKVVAAGLSDQTVRLWEVASQALLWTLEGHSGWVRSVRYVGLMLWTGGSDSTARLWDPVEGRLLHTLEKHTEAVLDVAASARHVATGSSDGSVRVFDVETMELVRVFREHRADVLSVAIANELVVSGSTDRTIKLWNIDARRLVCTVSVRRGWVHAVAFDARTSPLRLVATGADKHICMWNIETPASPKLERNFVAHDGSVLCLSVASDGRVATASSDRTARVWDDVLPDIKQPLQGPTHPAEIQAASASND